MISVCQRTADTPCHNVGEFREKSRAVNCPEEATCQCGVTTVAVASPAKSGVIRFIICRHAAPHDEAALPDVLNDRLGQDAGKKIIIDLALHRATQHDAAEHRLTRRNEAPQGAGPEILAKDEM